MAASAQAATAGAMAFAAARPEGAGSGVTATICRGASGAAAVVTSARPAFSPASAPGVASRL